MTKIGNNQTTYRQKIAKIAYMSKIFLFFAAFGVPSIQRSLLYFSS